MVVITQAKDENGSPSVTVTWDAGNEFTFSPILGGGDLLHLCLSHGSRANKDWDAIADTYRSLEAIVEDHQTG